MTIRVGKVTGVAAPKSVRGGFKKRGTGIQRLLQDLVHFFLAGDIVSQCDTAKTGTVRRQAGIFSQCVIWVQGQPGTGQLEKGNSIAILVSWLAIGDRRDKSLWKLAGP